MTNQTYIHVGLAGLTQGASLRLRPLTGAWMVTGASMQADATSLAERWKP